MSRWQRIVALISFCLMFSVVATRPVSAQEVNLTGAGATFPYPIYSKWFAEYKRMYPDVSINYQSIGSGGGIKQVLSQTVDFGATDGPMSDAQLKTAPTELFHIPMVMGADVVTYNVPGLGKGLKLTPSVLSDIFMGKITKWNDSQLTRLNSGMKLPNQDIIVVHRSDGSGTTYIFTDYLSSVSKEWANKVGKGTSVNWPVGLGGKGNEGVSGQIKQSPGSIGYVELIYAKKNNIPYALIQNREGQFVEPTLQSTSAAAVGAAANMPADFRVSLVNQPGKGTYPIASFTWLLVYKNQPDQKKGQAFVNFLWWAIHEGQKSAPALEYAPLPAPVVKLVEAKVKQITFQGKPLLMRNE